MTETEELAIAFGQGEASVEAVVEAARAAAGRYSRHQAVGVADYDVQQLAMQTDSDEVIDRTGWDGVVHVYSEGGLTDDQFEELHTAYMSVRR